MRCGVAAAVRSASGERTSWVGLERHVDAVPVCVTIAWVASAASPGSGARSGDIQHGGSADRPISTARIPVTVVKAAPHLGPDAALQNPVGGHRVD